MGLIAIRGRDFFDPFIERKPLGIKMFLDMGQVIFDGIILNSCKLLIGEANK